MRIATVALTVLAMGGTAITAGEGWNGTFEVGSAPEFVVETSDADILVTLGQANRIEVRVQPERSSLQELGIKVDQHQEGDVVRIRVKYPNSVQTRTIRRVEIHVQVPPETRLNLRTGDGDIDLSGIRGQMELASGDGNITVDGAQGVLRARTGDGDVSLSGRLNALNVSTGDGNVEVRALSGSAVTAPWSVQTGDGRVQLWVPADLAADLELRSHDGEVDVDLPLTIAGNVNSRAGLRGTLNGGGERVTIRTGDGSIHVAGL